MPSLMVSDDDLKEEDARKCSNPMADAVANMIEHLLGALDYEII
ncbi:hypothetical protein [Pseudoxanthomonas sp. LH2527]|nr:hypothetical protein [Pseudoxanthomonas sp. LH2527]